MTHGCPMKSAWRTFLLGISLAGSTGPLTADDAPPSLPEVGNSVPKGQSTYARTISTRNGFGLLDPTPPPQPPVVDPTPPPPPKPPSTVQLTGFSRWGGEKKVYLIVTKQGGKAPSYIDLREGEETFDIKAVQIDDQNETAKILNTGIEQTLNFKENGAKPVPGAPGGAPPQPNMQPGVPPPPIVAPSRYANAGPTVIGRNGVVNNIGATPPPTASSGTTFLVDGVPISNNSGQNPGFQGGALSYNPAVSSASSPNPNPNVTPRRVFNIPPPPLPPVQ